MKDEVITEILTYAAGLELPDARDAARGSFERLSLDQLIELRDDLRKLVQLGQEYGERRESN